MVNSEIVSHFLEGRKQKQQTKQQTNLSTSIQSVRMVSVFCNKAQMLNRTRVTCDDTGAPQSLWTILAVPSDKPNIIALKVSMSKTIQVSINYQSPKTAIARGGH